MAEGKVEVEKKVYCGSTADNILGVSEITELSSLCKMLVAECIGTFFLVVIGCGSCIAVKQTADYVNYVQVALAFGLAVATMAQAIGHVSGCHINPAVTVSFFVTGNIKLLRAIFFIVVQCVGAIGGSALLKLVTPDTQAGNLGLTVVSDHVTPVQAMMLEAVLTFLLVFLVHSVCDARREDIHGSAPLAIGLAVAAAHLPGIQYTGSSINPARTFGPAVIGNSWDHHWVYWVGPILGGIVAGLVYKLLFRVRKEESESYNF